MFKNTLKYLVLLIILTSCNLPSSPNAASNSDVSGGLTTPELNITNTVATPQSEPSSSTISPTMTATDTTMPSLGISIYGLQIHQLSSQEQLSLAQQAGVNLIRTDTFHWDDIEPVSLNPPAYDWSSIDENGLRMAAESGFEIIGVILYAPDWAQKYPGIACGPIKSEAFDEFAAFLGALVSRYSQPPYNIRFWEIGNEPDIDRALVPADMFFGCWGEEVDQYYGGGYYGEMLKAVYPAIKDADPDAKVLVGGLNLDCDPSNPPENPPGSGQLKDCTPSLFLEGILSSGGGDYFDGVSFHAYDYYDNNRYGNGNWQSNSETNGPVLIQKTRYLDDLLSKYGYEDKFLINTEVALLCGSDGKEPICQTDDFSNTKANYAAQAYAAALAEGLSGNLWYSLTGWRASGLVNSSLQPYEAYNAYKFSEAMLGSALFVREISDFPGVKGYEFTREAGNVWILWSLVDGEQEVQLPTVPLKVSSVNGETLPTEQKIMISHSPVYIEWSPE